MSIKSTSDILKSTLNSFSEDKVTRLSAALAYYAIFSIGPLLVLLIGVAGLIFGRQGVSQELQAQMQSFMGPKGASMVASMMSAQHTGGSLLATILGGVGLVLGATGVIGALQESLNAIWEVQPKPGLAVWGFIRARLSSLAVVLGVGFMLIVSMAMTGLVTALGHYVGTLIKVPGWVIVAANGVLTFAIITCLFALIFKYLPDVKVRWKYVWVGAFWTTVLFTIGQWLLGWYLGRQATTSAFGAAGSVVVILMYFYYSSLIFFFGAELTKAYAEHSGARIVPKAHAVPVIEERRAQEGRASEARVEDAARKQDERGNEGMKKAA